MKQLLILFCIVSLFACDDDFTSDISDIHPDNINLTHIREGQRSLYIRYVGKCGSRSDVVFTGDTLLLEVLGEEEGYLLQESFTPGSPLYKQNSTKVSYRVIPASEYLLLPDRLGSALFFFYGNDTLHTDNIERVPLYQAGCRIRLDENLFTGNEIGRISDFRIGGIKREELTAVSCVPMILDVDAYLMYDEYLHMSHTVNNSDNISGWALTGL